MQSCANFSKSFEAKLDLISEDECESSSVVANITYDPIYDPALHCMTNYKTNVSSHNDLHGKQGVRSASVVKSNKQVSKIK